MNIEQLPLISKRWRRGEERFIVPAHVIDPKRLRVEVVPERVARAFIIEHHYARSVPPSRMCVGVYDGTELVGAIAFTVPMSQHVIPKYLGVAPHEGVEIGRLVLLDRVPFNAESFSIARALRLLRQFDPKLKGAVSFADPLERRDPVSASLQKPSHFGTIYRASSARFVGRSGAKTLHMAPNGTILSPRALSKIRGDEVGRDYAERALVAAGVAQRASFESGRAWLERVLPELHRVRHPGNLGFAFDFKRRGA